MKSLKKSFPTLILLVLMIGSQTSAQNNLFVSDLILPLRKSATWKIEMANRDNSKQGKMENLSEDRLLLNGMTIDCTVDLKPDDELTVVKGRKITGEMIVVPFYVYLRRKGTLFTFRKAGDLTRRK